MFGLVRTDFVWVRIWSSTRFPLVSGWDLVAYSVRNADAQITSIRVTSECLSLNLRRSRPSTSPTLEDNGPFLVASERRARALSSFLPDKSAIHRKLRKRVREDVRSLAGRKLTGTSFGLRAAATSRVYLKSVVYAPLERRTSFWQLSKIRTSFRHETTRRRRGKLLWLSKINATEKQRKLSATDIHMQIKHTKNRTATIPKKKK